MPRRSHRTSRSPAALLPAVLLTLAGCGADPAPDPVPAAIAEVDGEQVAAEEFEDYLRATLGEEEAGEASDEVKSALLDDFLVERLVVADALAAGIDVGDEDLGRSLDELGLAGGDEAEAVPGELYRERLRRSLIVDRYLAETVVGTLDVGPDEMEAWTEAEADADAGPLVVYRQAMCESVEMAREIVRRVRRGKEPFARAAAELSLSPAGAEPQWAAVNQLPSEVRDALSDGPKGEVVGPVRVGCDAEAQEGCLYYVFLIEDREDRRRAAAPTTEEVRESVLREKQARRLQAYRDELRRSGRITIHEDRLPFRYAPKSGAGKEPS